MANVVNTGCEMRYEYESTLAHVLDRRKRIQILNRRLRVSLSHIFHFLTVKHNQRRAKRKVKLKLI